MNHAPCFSTGARCIYSDGCLPDGCKNAPTHSVTTGQSLLRPAVRPPKPRLRACMGIWTCETANLIAKGRTPAEAYREWQKAVAIRGAEVMRNLRPFA